MQHLHLLKVHSCKFILRHTVLILNPAISYSKRFLDQIIKTLGLTRYGRINTYWQRKKMLLIHSFIFNHPFVLLTVMVDPEFIQDTMWECTVGMPVPSQGTMLAQIHTLINTQNNFA